MFFHDYVMTWWEAGMLKIALLAIGIIIGAAWPKFFKKTLMLSILWIVAVVLLFYLVISLWPQI